MKLETIIESLGLQVKTDGGNLTQKVTGGYVSDLLSDVVANAEEGNLWVTLQVHPNIVAVATLKELSSIVLVNDRQPEKETLGRANGEGIPILTTERPAFELVGELYKLVEGK